MGYMPEGECLPKDQTAADFVAYAAQLAGIPRREARRRSSETLFLVGLEEERFRFLGDFSTGMQQRVKLAQAIVHDPDLLLLDEPASGLDPAGRAQMLQLIRRLGEFDINVIVSSHVLTDIEETCNWVVMLDAGDLLRNGPLEGFEKRGTVQVEVLTDPERCRRAADRPRATASPSKGDGSSSGPVTRASSGPCSKRPRRSAPVSCAWSAGRPRSKTSSSIPRRRTHDRADHLRPGIPDL